MRKLHQDKNLTFSQGLAAALICMLLTCAAVPLSRFLPGENAETAALILRDGVVLIIGAVLYFRASDPGADPSWEREHGNRKWWHVHELIALVILVFFGFKSASSLGTLAENALHSGSGSAELIRAGAGSSGVLLGIAAFVVIAPVMEELVVRGILFRTLRTRCSFAVSAVLSAAVWAVWHGNISQGITAFLTGLILALLYELYRNLWITILVHAGNNALALYTLNFPMNTRGTHSPDSRTGLVVLGCEILVAVYFYYKLLRNEPVRGRFSRD